jgi:REP element-mobilizing transposase RayT
VVEDTPCYFITNSTVWWAPIFISSQSCDIVIESLSYCRQHKGLLVFAYSIMPTHFHAVVSTTAPADLTGIVRDLKRHTSRKIVEALEASSWEFPLRAFRKAAALDGRGNQHKFWQDEFHPVAILTKEVLREKVLYTHGNPVRKGLVREAADWWYSSARALERGESGPLELDAVDW